ncbi:MAG TPA: hypothetical protein VM890_08475 [Longimicrobium sp.]|nr:hypothetical protein [Longimicrobium sp.]
MRIRLLAAVLCLGAAIPACSTSPTEQEIIDTLEQELKSVEGGWTGTASGGSQLTLDFQLQAGAGNTVSGSGTMREQPGAATVPITVTGTFSRPALSLTFSGMTYQGHAVQGTVSGSYTSVGGVSAPLLLTGTGYSTTVQVLLQEK